MTNKEVINAFVHWTTDCNSLNVRSCDGVLYSYNTAIAQKVGGSIIINATKYSVTTSKHQGYLRAEVMGRYEKNGIKVAKNVPYTTHDLRPYVVDE